MTTASDLRARHCTPQTHALPAQRVNELLAVLDGWRLDDDAIVRTFSFPDYVATLAFVNAIASMIHEQDHHPELTVTYNRCTVRYNTHSVNDGKGGLSDNDFICAARVDAIYRPVA